MAGDLDTCGTAADDHERQPFLSLIRVFTSLRLLKGAQGNFPDDRVFAYETRLEYARAKDRDAVVKKFRGFLRRTYAAPWLSPDPNARPERMSLDEMLSQLEAIPPGVCARQGSSVFYPARIPDLIGVKDRHYLDRTGLQQHHSAVDLMRYAALNQGADALASFGAAIPLLFLVRWAMRRRACEPVQSSV